MEPLDGVINPVIEAVADQINEVVEPLFEIWLWDVEQESTPFSPPWIKLGIFYWKSIRYWKSTQLVHAAAIITARSMAAIF